MKERKIMYEGFKVDDVANKYGMNYAIIEVVSIEGYDENDEAIFCGGINDKMILFYKGDIDSFYAFTYNIYNSGYIEFIKDDEEVCVELCKPRNDYFIWSKFDKIDDILYIRCGDDRLEGVPKSIIYHDVYSTDVSLTENEIKSILSTRLCCDGLCDKLNKALDIINSEKNNN